MISTDFRITSLLLPRHELPGDRKDEMFTVLDSCFHGVRWEVFEADLNEKNWIILLLRAERVVGFSTIHAYEVVHEGQRLNIIYSGDTIVAPEAWGSPVLPRSWIAGVNTILSQMPGSRSYWLLLSSGFRTYRFLPLFWKEFYPTYELATPAASARLLQWLAVERFGAMFQSGVVRFPAPQRLRPGLCEVPEELLQYPHIAYFVHQNPGHTQGDELVCLTELHPANLTRAGIRMVRTNEL